MPRPGPAFWENVYGVRSFDEFFDRIEPFLPDSVGYLIHFKDDQVARLMYENPASGLGNVAVAILTAQDLNGDDEQATADTARRGYAAITKEGDAAMAPLVIPGVFKVALQGLSGGQPVVTTFGVRPTGGQGAAAVAAAVRARVVAAAGPLPMLPPAYTLPSVKVWDLSSLDGAIAEATGSSAGSNAGTTLATNAACALVKWNGATRSGSSRGRIYHGPLTEAMVNSDGRTLASASQTSIKNAWQSVVDGLKTDGMPMVVISRKRLDATEVTSVAVESIIATQRRRIRD